MNIKGRIFISKDVVFNENDFPIKNGFQIGDHSDPTSQIQQDQFPQNLIQTSYVSNTCANTLGP